MPQNHPPISTAACCWTCTYSRFFKQSTRAKLRGLCLLTAEALRADFPYTWWPPSLIWNQIRDETFPDNIEEYESLAALYYGEAFLLAPDKERMSEDYLLLCAIASNMRAEQLQWISWLSTCSGYETRDTGDEAEKITTGEQHASS